MQPRGPYHSDLALSTIEAVYAVVPADRYATNLEIADRTRWSLLTVVKALRVLESRQMLVTMDKKTLNGRKLWKRAA